MKEYNPENGTYQNMEVDPETKEVHYGKLNPREEKIFYKFKNVKQWHLFSKWWFWVICAVVLIAPWVVIVGIHHYDLNNKTIDDGQVKQVVEEVREVVREEVSDNNAGTITIMDSSSVGDAYTEILDTMFQEHQLHIYKVHYGIPELYVCDSTDIDTNDMNIVFAAQAAEYNKQKPREICGLFINKGEVLATGSRHKEGFCAIIDHNITLGAGKNTSLSEEAINGEGYFFRNPPLVVNGIAQERANNATDFRRALCNINNEIVYIVCDEKMSLTDFAQLLSDFGVITAVNMMGSKGAVGFCRNQEGKLQQWGKNSHSDYTNINYLIWKKK